MFDIDGKSSRNSLGSWGENWHGRPRKRGKIFHITAWVVVVVVEEEKEKEISKVKWPSSIRGTDSSVRVRVGTQFELVHPSVRFSAPYSQPVSECVLRCENWKRTNRRWKTPKGKEAPSRTDTAAISARLGQTRPGEESRTVSLEFVALGRSFFLSNYEPVPNGSVRRSVYVVV